MCPFLEHSAGSIPRWRSVTLPPHQPTSWAKHSWYKHRVIWLLTGCAFSVLRRRSAGEANPRAGGGAEMFRSVLIGPACEGKPRDLGRGITPGGPPLSGAAPAPAPHAHRRHPNPCGIGSPAARPWEGCPVFLATAAPPFGAGEDRGGAPGGLREPSATEPAAAAPPQYCGRRLPACLAPWLRHHAGPGDAGGAAQCSVGGHPAVRHEEEAGGVREHVCLCLLEKSCVCLRWDSDFQLHNRSRGLWEIWLAIGWTCYNRV